jgi:signal transduction histidine kinase
MDESTLEKIFDPFFTTKEVGKGTGLGLSVSYGIINRFHGEIKVQSKLNEGSKFTISLPIANN